MLLLKDHQQQEIIDSINWFFHVSSVNIIHVLLSIHTLHKMKYEVHTKLPQISYQIQIWYAICGNLV